MSLVSRWYQRFQRLIHEFAKFGVIGMIGFLVTEGVFNLMIARHQATFTANAVSTLVAAVVTFAGNRYWTFRHRERTGMAREATVFLVLNVVGIGIQQACLEIAKHASGHHDKLTLNIAFLVGVALATLFRFWSYRKFVWLAQVADQAPPLPGALDRVPEAEQEAWEPALVPPEPVAQPPAPGPGAPGRNGHGQAGLARPEGPRHARSG